MTTRGIALEQSLRASWPDVWPGPKRIQRQRAKGWRMPEGAVYVGRPTRWGNPWRIGDLWCDALSDDAGFISWMAGEPIPDAATAVRAFDQDQGLMELQEMEAWYGPLRGHDLVCWCPLDQPCHADVLLVLANR
jgi:hypothetical protein